MTEKKSKKRPSKKAVKKTPFAKMELDDQVVAVQDALEEAMVYHYLAMEGGGMEIMDIQGNDIVIQYYGACGNCPVSETATLPFIEEVLREKVDKKIVVKTVEMDHLGY